MSRPCGYCNIVFPAGGCDEPDNCPNGPRGHAAALRALELVVEYGETWTYYDEPVQAVYGALGRPLPGTHEFLGYKDEPAVCCYCDEPEDAPSHNPMAGAS
jgi:hypothetical protein